MTPAQRKIYMKIYNQTEESKAAKKEWRNSKAGRKYHSEYKVNKDKKRTSQIIRRKISTVQQERDRKYNYEYTRRQKVRDRINFKRRLRRQQDIAYRLMERLRGRLKQLIKVRPKSTSKSLGCSGEFLKSYLENQFKPGMSWNNYGLYGWHIDHIKPLSSFDLANPTQYLEACHYTNLQPLWAEENLKKSNKL